jgi:hypothetical protein
MRAPGQRRLRRARAASVARLVRLGREIPAIGLALVWLFGLVLAPLLHLTLHASLEAHAHGRPETVLGTLRSCHDGHCHRAERSAVEGRADDDEAPAEHGRGSPLHGHVAALFPAPALVVPPFVAFGDRARPEPLAAVVDALPAPPSIARGPPIG